ncbi:MAG: DUF3800 domain-containing protein [Candidatus Thiodiazotropha sp. (ex Semelilucina semeliformis)]|nr:DUF3800 domain-containing protein [Candidatus Thiodiazotropha sp. (ex Semelilucina semeliformis)]
MIIFLDESGDLGFNWTKSKTSRYFVITLLVCNSREVQEGFKKAVRRTLKNKLNHKKDNKRTTHELKGAGTALNIKAYFQRHAPDDGWRIYSVTLNKARVNPDLQTKQGKKKLYNFLARFLLEQVVFPDSLHAVNLVVDRCKNSEEIKDFNQYVENQLQALLPLETRLFITHEASQENPGLQAVDLYCWGIARKDDKGDRAWYNLYCDKVVFETVYLKEGAEV